MWYLILNLDIIAIISIIGHMVLHSSVLLSFDHNKQNALYIVVVIILIVLALMSTTNFGKVRWTQALMGHIFRLQFI